MKYCKRKDSDTILPLSCNPNLDDSSVRGIDVYYDNLNKAFRNPRIRNIAVTGAYGVGKSSIIKSFDTHRRCFLKKTRFLYISLGRYGREDLRSSAADDTKTTVSEAVQTAAGSSVGQQSPTAGGSVAVAMSIVGENREEDQQTAREKEKTGEQNAIERRMLLQIYSRFRQKRFPASGFRLIPEQPSFSATSFFLLFAMAFLLLIFKKPLAELLLDCVDWELQWTWTTKAIKWIVDWHKYIELGLYLIVLSGAAFIFAVGFRWLCPKLQATKFSIKGTNAELNLEKFCEDYLDQYTQELVYCLEQVCDDIDRTVVFEDMDRLDEDICISIFTRLREINHVLNSHLGDKKYVRFIFVVSDNIANQLVVEKFFDYILPIIPTLNENSSEVIFRSTLKKINAELKTCLNREWRRRKTGVLGAWLIKIRDKFPVSRRKRGVQQNDIRRRVVQNKNVPDKVTLLDLRGLLSYWKRDCQCCNWFQDMENEGRNGIIHIAAHCLTDYRIQFAILNEYALMVRLYHRNNQYKLSCDAAERILAFLIYKYLWPNDYQCVFSGKPNVLMGKSVAEVAKKNHYELLQYLMDHKLLSLDSLHYAGFSKIVIQKLWKNRLEQGDVKAKCGVIAEMDPCDPDQRELVTDYCRIKADQSSGTVDATVLAATIAFILRDDSEDKSENEWFFSGRDCNMCLMVLEKLDDGLCSRFIERCKVAEDHEVFGTCTAKGGQLIRHGEWTLRMAEIYVSGTPNFKVPAMNLKLRDGTEVDMRSLIKQESKMHS